MSFSDLSALLGKPKTAQAATKKHPVVVIDDDEAIRESLTFLLSDRYHITTYGSAKEGVEAVNEDICAVILDVKMPGRDGFWACTEIRKKVPDIPVIFYSAYQNLKDPYAIINEHRPFGYVAKDSNPEGLIDILDVAVTLQAMIMHNRKLATPSP